MQSGQSLCEQRLIFGRATIGPSETKFKCRFAGRPIVPDTVCKPDKDRHPIEQRYNLIRIFVVNILGSMSFFSCFNSLLLIETCTL